jgi:hypothetical protein
VESMKTQPDVWVALRFTGPDGVPHELPKRSKVGAVPYAMQAQHAVTSSSAAAASAAAGGLAETLAKHGQDLGQARSAIDAIVGSSAVSVTSAAAINVPHATFVNLAFSRVEWDVLSEYTTASGFTAKNDGIYSVCGSVQWTAAVSASEIDVFIDGTRFRAIAGSSTGTCSGCVDVRLKAGQRAQVQVYQATGAPQAVAAQSLWSYLNFHRVY